MELDPRDIPAIEVEKRMLGIVESDTGGREKLLARTRQLEGALAPFARIVGDFNPSSDYSTRIVVAISTLRGARDVYKDKVE